MDTRPIAALFTASGPFVTVYVDTSGNVEDAAQRLGLRWKNARRDLLDAGADERDVDAVEGLVLGADHSDGDTICVIAAGGGVLHTSHHPDPPTRDLASFALLPRVGPLLEWGQSLLPHVVVVADRTGADIVAYADGDVVLEREVSGDDQVHRSAPGGWSQRRFQQRVENTWESNAADVAEEVARVADRTRARLVVVAGDVRAVGFLQESLPKEVLERVEVAEHGSRGPDGGEGAIAEEVVRLVATKAADDTVALLQEFREERGQDDRAADGPARTLEALARAQVETLLVHDDPDDGRTAWFGPEPGHVGPDAATVESMGVELAREARLVDVAIRAALGTGADVRIVPSTTAKDGIGAVLRYALR